MPEPASPVPANKAPYDTLGLFLTKDGHWVEGFIYDGDESDYAYVAYLPLPPIPKWFDKKTEFFPQMQQGRVEDAERE